MHDEIKKHTNLGKIIENKDTDITEKREVEKRQQHDDDPSNLVEVTKIKLTYVQHKKIPIF